MELAPGAEVADRYTVVRLLGKGGMGSVFVARDKKFQVEVALKVAGATGAAHDEFKARFQREARIGHRLGRVPGFVRALDWGELPDGFRLYLAMDLVADARTLDLLGGSRGERLARLRAAAALVGEAHHQKVIHRDVKPANFLQGGDGGVWLTDFGLAKVAGDVDEMPGEAITQGLTKSGAAMGTPAYMAPECFDDVRTVDGRADVYALGVMLHVALTGRFPYEGSDARSIWRAQDKVREGKAPAPRPRALEPDVPEPLDALCVAALHLDPGARLASVDAFVAGLDAALAAAPDGGALPDGATRTDASTLDVARLHASTLVPPSSGARPTASATSTPPSGPQPGRKGGPVDRAAVAVVVAALLAATVGAKGGAKPPLLALGVLVVAVVAWLHGWFEVRFPRHRRLAPLLAGVGPLAAFGALKLDVRTAPLALAAPFVAVTWTRLRGRRLRRQLLSSVLAGLAAWLFLAPRKPAPTAPELGVLVVVVGIVAPLHAWAADLLARRRAGEPAAAPK